MQLNCLQYTEITRRLQRSPYRFILQLLKTNGKMLFGFKIGID